MLKEAMNPIERAITAFLVLYQDGYINRRVELAHAAHGRRIDWQWAHRGRRTSAINETSGPKGARDFGSNLRIEVATERIDTWRINFV
jgi:hypothetical protein